MNLGDPELEMIDPTPNVQSLFVHFDKTFFYTSLASRTAVRWSKKMYSCAGVCSYEGRSGFCDIALSEPLLKLRPRKDLVETLLHEMIHAYLFVTNRDQDRDGHGPNFKAHMFRINKAAGVNISIYHSFHDEVEIYQTHWWRCNGPCQTRRPHFGIVRRAMNRAPGPSEYWWNDHKMRCGGTFIKIKEPQKDKDKKALKEQKDEWLISNPDEDIAKYIRNSVKIMNNVPNIAKSTTPVLKDTSNVIGKAIRKNSSNVVVINKTVRTVPKPVTKPTPVNTGSGNTDVTETVRNIWANKNIPGALPGLKKPENKNTGYKEPVRGVTNPKKHKTTNDLPTPPTKMKKIEDYFNATTILKDLYGDDYEIKQSNNTSKLVAVNLKVEFVICPVCSGKFHKEQINTHLDECLNKDLIEKLTKDGGAADVQETPPIFKLPDTSHKPKRKEITPPPAHPTAAKPIPDNNSSAIDLTIKYQDTNLINTAKQEKDDSTPKKQSAKLPIPMLKPISPKPECSNNNLIDLTNLNVDYIETNVVNKGKIKTDSLATSEIVNIETVTSLVEEIDEALKVSSNLSKNNKRRHTDGFVQTNRGDHLPSGAEKVADKTEPKAGPSSGEVFGKICPCCGKEFGDGEVEEHLDECLMFFDSNATIPEEGANRSVDSTILIEDDDKFDESQIFNDTGTKTPCPVCLKMVEQDDMNLHLDWCLQS